MSEEIKPAMSREEWAAREATDEMGAAAYLLADLPNQVLLADGDIVGYRRRHALAALCLYGQPEGFAQEDVELLRHYAERERHFGFASLAARITALLPPA